MQHSNFALRAFVPGLLFAVLALVFGCASCAFDIKPQGYPSDLGFSFDPHVVVWCSNAESASFRGLATPYDEQLEPDDKAFDFEWPCDLEQTFPAKIGSFTVLLDPAPSAALRARVAELSEAVALRNPGASTSVTVCTQAVGEVENGEQLISALERMLQAKLCLLRSSNAEPVVEDPRLFIWFGYMNFGSLSDSNCIVVPNAALPGEYFVLQDADLGTSLPLAPDWKGEVRSMPAEEFLSLPLGECEWLLFFELSDTPAEVSSALRALKQRCTPQPGPGVTSGAVLRAWPLRYEDATSTTAVLRSLQGRSCACACSAPIQP